MGRIDIVPALLLTVVIFVIGFVAGLTGSQGNIDTQHRRYCVAMLEHVTKTSADSLTFLRQESWCMQVVPRVITQ